MLLGSWHSGAEVLQVLQVWEVPARVVRATFDDKLDLLPGVIKHVRTYHQPPRTNTHRESIGCTAAWINHKTPSSRGVDLSPGKKHACCVSDRNTCQRRGGAELPLPCTNYYIVRDRSLTYTHLIMAVTKSW